MNKVLLYSGGFDSTYALAELCRTATEDDTITALSFQHTLTGHGKNHREREQQCRIIGAIRDHFPNVKLHYEVIRIESLWSVGSTYNCCGLSHPIFWSCNLIPLLADGDTVYFGYIKGDDAIRHLDNIKKLFADACAIQEYKLINVEFPNMHLDKVELIYNLVNNYDWLVDLCISCEGEDYNGMNVCGWCVPCKHLKRALVQLALEDNDKVSTWATATFNKLFHTQIRVTTEPNKDDVCVERPVDEERDFKKNPPHPAPSKKKRKKTIDYSHEEDVYVDSRFD